MRLNRNIINEIWRSKLILISWRSPKFLWIASAIAGILLFLFIPTKRYEANLFHLKVMGFILLLLLSGIVNLVVRRKDGQVKWKFSYQFFILTTNIYYVAWILVSAVCLLYRGSELLLSQSIEIPTEIILWSILFIVLITFIMSPQTIQRRSVASQFKGFEHLPKIIVLASMGPALGILLSVLSRIAGAVSISKVSLSILLILSALFMISAASYGLYELVLITLHQWPEIRKKDLIFVLTED